MMSLAELNDQRVSVAFPLNGVQVRLDGIGRYEEDVELGPVLRIPIIDQPGNLQIILRESEWKGTITPVNDQHVAYLIQLAAGCVSVN